MAQGVINHFSYSQLSTYLTCPLRYRYQYVERIPPSFTASSLVFGQAVHEAVAACYQSHLEGEVLRPDQMLDVYRQTCLGVENLKHFNGDCEDSLTDKAKLMLKVFHDAFDPDVQIIGIEEFFEVQFVKQVPPFQGYIDLIEESPNATISIVDLKTAARKPTKAQASNNLQLTAYTLGAEALGFDPEQLSLRLDVVTKTKSPELVRFETTRTQQERGRFVKLVKSLWSAIERHAFFHREDWHCSQCAWADHCRDW